MRERVLGVRNVAMRRRVTIKQIAEKAGLSVATVDRVINARRSVRQATALRVQSAREALGYQPTVSVESVQEPLRGAVLLQRKGSSTYQHLAEMLRQARPSAPGRRIELTIEFMEDYLEPTRVAEQMRSVGERADVLAVVAADSPYTSEVIDALSRRKVPVVALLSDLSAPNLAGYVGINNRIAGRTAAWAIARCAARPGSIGVLMGSHGYLGQEDRETGFRSYFREKGLGFKVLEPIVCGDDPDVAYKEALELITGAKDLVGLYSVGGGNIGTIRALEERLISTRPAFVCHELVSPQRAGLSRGTIDVVLAADLPQVAQSTLDLFVELKDLSDHKKRIVVIPFHIYTSENVLESNAVGE
jgi:LacI family transcriptional regulator, galactose operon repressor